MILSYLRSARSPPSPHQTGSPFWPLCPEISLPETALLASSATETVGNYPSPEALTTKVQLRPWEARIYVGTPQTSFCMQPDRTYHCAALRLSPGRPLLESSRAELCTGSEAGSATRLNP